LVRFHIDAIASTRVGAISDHLRGVNCRFALMAFFTKHNKALEWPNVRGSGAPQGQPDSSPGQGSAATAAAGKALQHRASLFPGLARLLATPIQEKGKLFCFCRLPGAALVPRLPRAIFLSSLRDFSFARSARNESQGRAPAEREDVAPLEPSSNPWALCQNRVAVTDRRYRATHPAAHTAVPWRQQRR
jgi:hypothetical protein